MSGRRFVMSLIQLKVGMNKCDNLSRVVHYIKTAVGCGAKLVALPESFNSPYGTGYFKEYAEAVPCGETCAVLSATAKECGVYIVGGSIPEADGCEYYNTCTVWNPAGEMVAKHRKLHLFDIDIPGRISFKESDTLSQGSALTTFQTEDCKIGLGICYDLRFEEMARLYRKQGCDMILYPGAFNMTTGPLHWAALLTARAIDAQVFVAGIATATDECASYVSYGHSMVVSPWGKVLTEAREEEVILYANINLNDVKDMRAQIPTGSQRRHDLYETIDKLCTHCAPLQAKKQS